jgi:uncharacterized protein YoxC
VGQGRLRLAIPDGSAVKSVNYSAKKDQIMPQTETIEELIARLAIATEKMLEGMGEIKVISLTQAHNLERLLHIATHQQETIQEFVKVFGEQAVAISDLSRSLRDSVESSRQLAQTVQSAAVLARSNQDTIKKLLEELRQTRLN